MVKKINDDIRTNIPNNYESLHYWDKLYCLRSDLQSITHVDFSARIQTRYPERDDEISRLG